MSRTTRACGAAGPQIRCGALTIQRRTPLPREGNVDIASCVRRACTTCRAPGAAASSTR